MIVNASLEFFGFFCIIYFGSVSSEDPFTIFLDGGSEFKSIKDDLNSLKSDMADALKEMQTRFNLIEAKVDKLNSIANGLADGLKNLSQQLSKNDGNNSRRACTVKLEEELNYKYSPFV
ncbi:uncharacterized protein LOC118736690 [Rhagoletis pomonella]|uniref:uncharacterized protein LOC118736690 n=1 Tax=Rhagoletis pomonella TaxID=28610 RepID=UPI0017840BDE|nr:uncharacterized protein LOC118736690 [Rhagoletis pomonella]